MHTVCHLGGGNLCLGHFNPCSQCCTLSPVQLCLTVCACVCVGCSVPWWIHWSKQGSYFQLPVWLWAQCWAVSPGLRCVPCGLTYDSQPPETEDTHLWQQVKVGKYKIRNKMRVHMVCSKVKIPFRELQESSNNIALYFCVESTGNWSSYLRSEINHSHKGRNKL